MKHLPLDIVINLMEYWILFSWPSIYALPI